MSGVLVLAILAVCAPADRPIVAEVYYDAIGDDTGREFVELFNPSASGRSLAGVRIEAGDGAGPGRWTPRWTGGAADSVRAFGRFVVGGALVVPAPDAVVPLDLQNGPDAMRVVWPDGALEVVGWGASAYPEYACVAPAPDVPSGLSLARVPDAADSGSNALDFRAATPSPGRANQPQRDAALATGRLTLDPAQPDPRAAARLGGVVVNRGAAALAAGEVRLGGEAIGADGAIVPLFSLTLDRAIAPAESAGFAADAVAPPAGKWLVVARAALAGDEAPENDADSLRVRVGPGPLRATEIQFHPAAAEGEWVEVANAGGAPLDLGAFTLADRHGDPGAIDPGPPLAPESLAVLAQDPAALLARFAGLDPERVRRVHPWPSLNNADDSSGVADVVDLREADGTPCERVGYSGSGVPAGVPLERRGDGAWVAADGVGTPLRPPRVLPPIAGRFEVAPRRVDVAGAVRLSWALPWDARVALDLHDLAGRRVASLRADAPAARRGGIEWRADALPPGLYLVTLRARAESGGGAVTETLPLRVRGAVPR